MRLLLTIVLLTGLVGISVSQTCLPAVGTKEYCPDSTDLKTWEEAEAFCKLDGRALATIRTPAESETLRTSHNDPAFSGEYWVAGRDVQEIQQFVWSLPEGNTAYLDVRFNEFMEPREPLVYQTCLVYGSVAEGLSGLKMLPCDSKANTLCEKTLESWDQGLTFKLF